MTHIPDRDLRNDQRTAGAGCCSLCLFWTFCHFWQMAMAVFFFPSVSASKIYIFASFSWCIQLHFKRKISHEGCFVSALSKTRHFTQSKILLLLVSSSLTSSWVVPYDDAKSLWQDVLAHAVHLNCMLGCLNVGKRTKQHFFPRTPLQFSAYRNWIYSSTVWTQQRLWLRQRCYHSSRVPSS